MQLNSVILAAAVLAQQNCDDTNFAACLQQNQIFLDSTCTPLQKPDPTNYQKCLCYQLVNAKICYAQCPNNSTVQTQFTNGVLVNLNAQCKTAQLDPNNLPQPAPWVTYTATSTVGSSTQTVAGSAASGTTTQKASANGLTGSAYALALGIVGMLF
ncbi:hypothetical protein HDV06_002112 [Boothiomyces sp. JEL0866]|nr:hypothetical protein HDV06_002112 [Boothiomyces sp. JEL0866]